MTITYNSETGELHCVVPPEERISEWNALAYAWQEIREECIRLSGAKRVAADQ